jgi:hypothetical protein
MVHSSHDPIAFVKKDENFSVEVQGVCLIGGGVKLD